MVREAWEGEGRVKESEGAEKGEKV